MIVLFLEQTKKKAKILLIILLLIFTLQYNWLQAVSRTKAPINIVVKEIKAQMKPGDALYVTSELNFHPAEYYLDDKRVYIYGKTYQDLPQYIGKVLIPKNKVTDTLPIYPHKAFVLHDDLTYDIRSQF